MLGSESVTNVLLAVATGFTDRALNVVAMSDEIDDEARATLYQALVPDADPSTQARRFGDALRSMGAERNLVNECYRVSFYAGEEWKRLLDSPLFAFFSANRGGIPLDKWVHYFPIYERHLARYRGKPVRVLEIGVYRGGGLELLHSYLGPEANLVGIDIDEAARTAVRGRYPVEIGDQADVAFLQRLAAEYGPFDIVVDDGGHTMRQQVASVETLFPFLADGATYIVEDCHTSYWPEFADQDPDAPTFIAWLKSRIDDLHAYHFPESGELTAPWQTRLAGVHVYDSVAVLDADQRTPPFSEVSGTKEYINYGRSVSILQLEMLATRDAALVQAADAQALVAQASASSQGLDEEVRILRGELVDAQQMIARMRAEIEGVQDELDELAHTRSDLLGAWNTIEEMRRSRSWRLTAPLRRGRSVVTRR